MASYGYKVFKTKVENHEFWIVESNALKGCSAQGDTLDEALKEFKENEQIWLETAIEFGINIPEEKIEKIDKDFSGRILVRVAKSIHSELTDVAKQEGVSINHLVSTFIARGLGSEERESKDSKKARVELKTKAEIEQKMKINKYPSNGSISYIGANFSTSVLSPSNIYMAEECLFDEVG